MSANAPALHAALAEVRLRAVPALISCVFFGMFTLLFGGSSYLLIKRGLRQWSNTAMLLITSGMYAASTVYLCVDMYSYLSSLSNPSRILSMSNNTSLNRATTLTVSIGWNFMFSDLVVLWRACALWKKKRSITWVSVGLWVAAFILAIGDIVTNTQHPAIILVDGTVTSDGVSFVVPQPTMDRWGQICIFVSFLANLWVTVLYAVKTIKFRKVARSPANKDDPQTQLLYQILILLLDFSIAYCIFWLIFICISITDTGDMSGSSEHLALENAIAQITGIYPTAIIVLVSWHQKRAEEVAAEGRLPSRARSSRPLAQLDSVVISDPSSDEVDRTPRTANARRSLLESRGYEFSDMKEPVDDVLGSDSGTVRNDSDLSKSSGSRRGGT